MSSPNKNDTAKSNDDGVCEVNDMLQNMKTADEEDDIDTNICANCGKEGSDVTNSCNKCKLVMYCNAACKKKHRHKHKKECEEHQRLAAEHAAKLHDEALFEHPPSEYEDCPICFQRMPSLPTGSRYKSCCGKTICNGCIYAVQMRDRRLALCPFCRTPTPASEEEAVKRIKKRIQAGDAEAMNSLACDYRDGKCGFPQNYTKALDLWHQAAELGFINTYCSIGYAYEYGRGVDIDKKKARHYYELAAMGGDVYARHNLGSFEGRADNMDRALKHFMIAVRDGYTNSLKTIKLMYKDGQVTKDDYSKALRSYQEYLNEVKSSQRDEAAEADDYFKYIE